MQILYNLAAILVVILIIPVFMIRSVREKGFVERIRQMFGTEMQPVELTALRQSAPAPALSLAAQYLRLFAQRVSRFGGIQVLGPADEPVAKIQDIYRKVMYLKSPDEGALTRARDMIRRYIEINSGFKGITFQYETD